MDYVAWYWPLITLIAGYYAGIATAAVFAAGKAEDEYNKGYRTGYEKAQRNYENNASNLSN